MQDHDWTSHEVLWKADSSIPGGIMDAYENEGTARLSNSQSCASARFS